MAVFSRRPPWTLTVKTLAWWNTAAVIGSPAGRTSSRRLRTPRREEEKRQTKCLEIAELDVT